MAARALAKVLGKLHNFRRSPRHLVLKIQKKNLASLAEPPNLDEPIKYSGTKASKMNTMDTFKLKPNPAVLPIERTVILITTIIALFYFSMLRTENKIDRILDGSFDYEEEDEIKVLNALLHAKLKGLNTEDLEKKLQMIRAQKK